MRICKDKNLILEFIIFAKSKGKKDNDTLISCKDIVINDLTKWIFVKNWS